MQDKRTRTKVSARQMSEIGVRHGMKRGVNKCYLLRPTAVTGNLQMATETEYLGIKTMVNGFIDSKINAIVSKAKDILANINRVGMNVRGFDTCASLRLYKSFFRPVTEDGKNA